MAVSQADIDALNAAIAAGVRQVTLAGQTTTYNTTASLIQARDDLLTQMRRENTPRRNKRTLLYYAGRGY